jgi:hypothetical protein
VVIDAGANRGLFSALVTPIASRIICVEFNNVYHNSILQVMKANNYVNFSIEPSFLGDGGADRDSASGKTKISIPEICNKYGIERIGLLKLDIEGSEFDLFLQFDWLNLVDVLAIEIHPQFGNVLSVSEILTNMGFIVISADENLYKINPSQKTNFIYAFKNS